MSRRSALAIALLLAVGPAGCATEDGAAGPPRTTEPSQDAVLRYFAPDEVDSLPRLLTPIEPPYPPGMRARGREGDVKARVLVRADGSVAGAELLEATHADFSAALREVIRDARFAPALREGRPVPAWVTLHVRFRLG